SLTWSRRTIGQYQRERSRGAKVLRRFESIQKDCRMTPSLRPLLRWEVAPSSVRNQLRVRRRFIPIGFKCKIMSNSDRSRVIHLAEARARIPGPAGEHSVSVMQRGSLNLKLSLPVAPNQQTPHEQDEIYLIVSGKGVLFHHGKRETFEP